MSSQANGPGDQRQASGQAELLWKQCTAMFAAGAALGPLCDGQHSSHDVLHYERPVMLQIEPVNLHLETCWWVPLLFGCAGVILGIGHPLLDDLLAPTPDKAGTPAGGRAPGWGFVYLGIALFVMQYAASGALEQPLLHTRLLGLPAIDLLLAATAVAHWWSFDRTRQGFFWAVLTAAAGPAVEIFLINALHLYHYSHPQLLGIPTWIPWVYFCGAPAVGGLGRRVRRLLEAQIRDAS
ncbi:hypothetical protein WJX72_000432 [[Myrmecia] bisecta]|uniref:Uncharacterized protein n=1 Tax=[Myrmecia] bisecta TaxID=41462 RepID=A0AAW1PMU5_9CHLO